MLTEKTKRNSVKASHQTKCQIISFLVETVETVETVYLYSTKSQCNYRIRNDFACKLIFCGKKNFQLKLLITRENKSLQSEKIVVSTPSNNSRV